jgi:uncharacterized protein YbgA (DUF1722 family)/uncharacterized protein YbbK (DUF523 family)
MVEAILVMCHSRCRQERLNAGQGTVNERIKLGISSCLIGEEVRYDGGHKLDRFLRDVLGAYVEWVPVCPEVECGLPVPREAMRLVGDPGAPRFVTIKTKQDHTDRMMAWARTRVAELGQEDLCGFIFKSRSPSSGLFRVKVYREEGGPPSIKGVGIFAGAFRERFPLLPAEEEGRLYDSGIRENFIERVFTLKRWREMLALGKKRGHLVDFHTRHKLLILSHSRKHYMAMGRLVAKAKAMPEVRLFAAYEGQLMEAMACKATPKKHTDVLMHMMGYFKRVLTSDEKKELLEILERFKGGLVPLIVPVTLMDHYVRKYSEPYLARQVYLRPHPLELKLRNHV